MEKKREITEEQVKEYQMLLAQWMQLPKDALEILNEDMPWRIREWLYVCALDQISGAELQAMKPQGLKKIQDIRAKFLKQKFQDLKEIQTQMNALQKQMEEGGEKQATVLSRLGWKRRNRGIFGTDCGRKNGGKHSYIGNRRKWINLSNRC